MSGSVYWMRPVETQGRAQGQKQLEKQSAIRKKALSGAIYEEGWKAESGVLKGEPEAQEGGNTCTVKADSHYGMAEANATL